MTQKINTKNIKAAAANLVVAGKKAGNDFLNILMLSPIVFSTLAGVLDFSGFWDEPKVTNASMLEIPEGVFVSPQKIEPLISEPTKVEENLETPAVVELQSAEEVNPVEVTAQIDSRTVNFVNNYAYKGTPSRLRGEYLDILFNACHQDNELLRRVVAISTHETGQGAATTWRQSNFWGWFKGGNKNYDPDQATMATDICTGIRDYYPNLWVGGQVNYQLAVRYSGNDRPDNWVNTVQWAYNSMLLY